ncbi:hypothetical protein HDU86_008304 [Geranomyces michiganensis]|nr:hypothetical protein HDU86_008304 [Geranomyces michiganensis]
MDKRNADSSAERAAASGRVSEAVRSLRSNLDKKYSSKPSDVPIRAAHASKVRRQVAAIEDPASLPALDARIAASARGKIEAFERLANAAAAPAAESRTVKEPINPMMTPSRKAAVASKRVSTRSQSREPESGPATATSCATPRAWPEIRTRKVLFEPNTTEAANDANVGDPPLTPTRRSQRLSVTAHSTPQGNSDRLTDKPTVAENQSSLPEVDIGPAVTYPNPFDDDENPGKASLSNSIFAGVPSPIRKSIRTASRSSSAPIAASSAKKLKDSPIESTVSSTALDHQDNNIATETAATATDSGSDPADVTKTDNEHAKLPATSSLLVPKTPTKINTLTKEQKAAMKTPSKSVARKSARKLGLPELSADATNAAKSTEDVLLGTPTKVSGTAELPKNIDSDIHDEADETEDGAVAQTPSRSAARLAAQGVLRSPVMAKHRLVDEEVQTVPAEMMEGTGKRKRSSRDDDEDEDDANAEVEVAEAREKRRKIVKRDVPAASKKKRVAFGKMSSSRKTRASRRPVVFEQYDANTMDLDGAQPGLGDLGLFSAHEQWMEEKEEENEGDDNVNSDDEGGWLLSVFFKAARLAGLR